MKKRYIKIPKDFFKDTEFKIDVPEITEYHEWCPECRAWREEQIKTLLESPNFIRQ